MKCRSVFGRKLLIRCIIPGFLFCMALPALAAEHDRVEVSLLSNSMEAPPRNSYRYKHQVWNNYVGDLFLSGGFSPEFKYGSQAGAKLVVDYMLSEKVSCGAQSGLYFLMEDGQSYRSSYLGIRTSYHLLHANPHHGQNHWNVYLGVSVEREWGGGKADRHMRRYCADVHFGARYMLGKKVFLWGEAAINNVALGLTLSI